jgi:hypothetical protein
MVTARSCWTGRPKRAPPHSVLSPGDAKPEESPRNDGRALRRTGAVNAFRGLPADLHAN